MSNPSKSSPGQDSDVHISRENQKKINTFAIRNAWCEELSTELRAKQKELKCFEDAEADILMLEDPTSTVPVLIGDCWVHYSQENVMDKVNEMTEAGKKEVKRLESKISEIKAEMAVLKNELYSQFGDNINLENEEA